MFLSLRNVKFGDGPLLVNSTLTYFISRYEVFYESFSQNVMQNSVVVEPT